MALVKRSKRLAFLNVGTSESPSYTRMTKFTSISSAKNPKEYSRQYVDEDFETAEVVGYSPSIDYAFDRDTDNAVQEVIAAIHDGELIGAESYVDILVLDLFDETDGKCTARLRKFAVIPSNDGDSLDALTYSGTLKAVSDITTGTAELAADGQTATFTPTPTPAQAQA